MKLEIYIEGREENEIFSKDMVVILK